MRVLFVSAEIFPLAKTGGLADVSAALPAALADAGIDIRLVMPGYPEALDRVRGKQDPHPLGELPGAGPVSLVPARMPDTDLPIWLVDCPNMFRRPGGLYMSEPGIEWADNHERFALLSSVAERIAMDEAGLAWRPHIVHANDWHAGPLAALLACRPGRRPGTVLTLHNMAFQGLFPASVFPSLGLPADMFSPDGVEFFGQVSFLKAGIRYADRLTTVSPTYASEILTPDFGCGMDGLLRWRAPVLEGISNGIDTDTWNSEDPTDISYPFSPHDLSGKTQCKAALQVEVGLEVDSAAPLIAFVGRLTEQKMADMLPAIMSLVTARGAQLILVGRGDPGIEHQLREAAAALPGRVAVQLGYTEKLAKQSLAGADIVLVPSRFEPCGLVQMYAMRYGAVPIARRTGGLADTVDDSTGFLFEHASLESLQGAVERALKLFSEPLAWHRMQTRGMERDFSWRTSATRYRLLYESLCHARSDAGDLVEILPEAKRRTSARAKQGANRCRIRHMRTSPNEPIDFGSRKAVGPAFQAARGRRAAPARGLRRIAPSCGRTPCPTSARRRHSASRSCGW